MFKNMDNFWNALCIFDYFFNLLFYVSKYKIPVAKYFVLAFLARLLITGYIDS